MSYSARALEGATVAAPVAWEGFDQLKSAARFSIGDAGELLDRADFKSLAGWGQAKQGLPKA